MFRSKPPPTAQAPPGSTAPHAVQPRTDEPVKRQAPPAQAGPKPRKPLSPHKSR